MRDNSRYLNSPRIFLVALLLLWGVGTLISGCAHTIPLNATVSETGKVTKVPLAVGVFYTPQFRAYKHEGSRMGDKWIYNLGEASVNLFDKVFPTLFQEARHVQERPPIASGEDYLNAVIVPKIEAFDFSLPFLKTGIFSAEITYRFTLYSLEGDPFASWTVKGEGEKKGQFGFSFSRWPGEAADHAMEDAARKFMFGFRDEPEVRRWLIKKGLSSLK